MEIPIVPLEFARRCNRPLMHLVSPPPHLMRRGMLSWLLLAFSLMGPLSPSAAQQTNVVPPSDTSSPRATLQAFIDSCNEMHKLIQLERYFDRTSPKHHPHAMRIIDCLDLSGVPEYERLNVASEAAACLKEILDRVDLPPFEEIPDSEAIRAAGGPEQLTRWRIPGTRITIARAEEGPNQHEYLFSPGTVKRAKSYYNDMKVLPYRETGPSVSPGLYRWFLSSPGQPTVAAIVDLLPAWMRRQTNGLAVWQWVGLVLAVLVAILLMAVTYRLHGALARRYRDTSVFRYSLTIVFPIVAALIPLAFHHVALHYLTIRGGPLSVVSFLAYMTTLVASLVVAFGVCNRIAEIIIASPHISPGGLDAQFIRIVSKLLGIVASVIIFLEGGNYLGIPVTTLIASAGVGGLAVALAAQGTLKSLFGTIMLLTDKPFRVGDRIVFGKYDGVVQEIGLRSTRIRLLTGHEASVPNDKLADSDIENVGRRPHIRRTVDIHVPLDTPREKIEQAVAIIRATLENHEGMQSDFPPRVYFFDFNSSSFTIRVIYWYSPPNYWDYLAFSERINFEIVRAFERQGIQFTLPFRITDVPGGGAEKPHDPRAAAPSEAK